MKNTLFYILGYFFVFIVFRFFRYGTRFAFDYNLISLDDIAIFLVVGVLLYFIFYKFKSGTSFILSDDSKNYLRIVFSGKKSFFVIGLVFCVLVTIILCLQNRDGVNYELNSEINSEINYTR